MLSKPSSEQAAHALVREHSKRVDVPLLAASAFALLAWGVSVPALTFDNPWPIGNDTFSVWTGIRSFFEHGNILLGLLLASFSVAFPAAKLLTIAALWFLPMAEDRRKEVVEWLELLGKWSLLDAFVIAVLIGTVQFGLLTEAVAEPGVYIYLAAIVLSLVTTFLLRPLVGGKRESTTARQPRLGLVVTIPSSILYGIGLSLPLMYVEKGWFWDNEFSVLDGTRDLFARGEIGLALALAAFVIALPTVRFLGLIALRASESERSFMRVLRLVDKWSMADVFVLAALVVITKVSAIASVEPRAGMWCLCAAALLNGIDSILLYRKPRALS